MTLAAGQLGMSPACAIILLTLAVRLALMPLSLGVAVRAQRGRRRMALCKPELDALQARLADRPRELAAATMDLYRRHGVTPLDRLALLNAGAQAGIGLGMLGALRGTRAASPFLWITDIGRPDFALTAVVALLTCVAMLLAPDAAAQPALLAMAALSCLVTVFTLASMPSAIGIYWAASSVFSIGQALALRAIVRADGAVRP